MTPPISPRHRPPAEKIPDGMSLLYADLPEKPEPPKQRARVELAIAGALAAAGAAAAGTGIAGDLMRRFVRPASDVSAPVGGPEAEVPFTGVERIVGAPVVVPPVLAPVPESEFAAPAAGEAALAEIVVDTPAPALPATPAPPRTATMGSSRPAPPPTPAQDVDPADPEDPPPTTTTTAAPAPTTTTIAPDPDDPAPTTTTSTTTTTTTTVPPQPTIPPLPFDQIPTPGSPVYVLAVGAGYEVTPNAAATIAVHGFDGWVDRQLEPELVADETVDELIAHFSLLASALSEARWADFARGAFSERQIEAQLAAFWRSWFALPADDLSAQLELDQLARSHALGRYADLVGAVASSPGLQRSHGIDVLDIDAVLDSSLAQRVLVDWVYGPDAPIDDGATAALAQAIVAGRQATIDHLAILMIETAAVDHVGGAVGELIGGAGSTAAAAAVQGFGRSGVIRDAVRAALVDGGVLPDRPAAAGAWLVRSLQRSNATVTVGGTWDPTDRASVPGLLDLLGAQPGDRLRNDDDERTPAAVAARWEAARTVAAGGTGIVADLGSAAPTDPVAVDDVVDHVAAIVDVSLADGERQAVLDYLGVGAGTNVRVAAEPFVDLCALALSFPSALVRAAA